MRQELTYNLCSSYWDKLSGNELLLSYFLLGLKWCSKSSTLISETDQFSTGLGGSTHLAIDFWGDLSWAWFSLNVWPDKTEKRGHGLSWEVGVTAGRGEAACGWSSSPLEEWQNCSSCISGGIYLVLHIWVCFPTTFLNKLLNRLLQIHTSDSLVL